MCSEINALGVQKVEGGYLIPKELHDKISHAICDIGAKIYFLKQTAIVLEDKIPSNQENLYYGIDVILADTKKDMDNLYEILIDV